MKFLKLKFILLSFVFSIAFSFSSSASIGPGCGVAGVLYTSQTSKGNHYFYNSPNLLSDCGFKAIPKKIGACYIYKGTGPLNKNSSYYKYNKSWGANWEEINCPLDNQVWLLILSAVIFSVYRLRPIFKF